MNNDFNDLAEAILARNFPQACQVLATRPPTRFTAVLCLETSQGRLLLTHFLCVPRRLTPVYR
jgi:hypothetical protein